MYIVHEPRLGEEAAPLAAVLLGAVKGEWGRVAELVHEEASQTGPGVVPVAGAAGCYLKRYIMNVYNTDFRLIICISPPTIPSPLGLQTVFFW